MRVTQLQADASQREAMFKQKIALLENSLKDSKISPKDQFSLPNHRGMHVNTIGASPVKAALYSQPLASNNISQDAINMHDNYASYLSGYPKSVSNIGSGRLPNG